MLPILLKNKNEGLHNHSGIFNYFSYFHKEEAIGTRLYKGSVSFKLCSKSAAAILLFELNIRLSS
jgi:hypothetical protein